MNTAHIPAPASDAPIAFPAGKPLAWLKAFAARVKLHLFPLPGQELEAYLAGSVDLVDLEFRLNTWEWRRTRYWIDA